MSLVQMLAVAFYLPYQLALFWNLPSLFILSEYFLWALLCISKRISQAYFKTLCHYVLLQMVYVVQSVARLFH